MRKQKDKILKKIIKKDYNNELEEVLAKKDFEEEVKNLLLDILYKIENAYADYTEVKVNVLDKDKYIQNVINIIKNDCDSIKFMTTSSENKSFKVDGQNKEIVCYPMERKLLYCLAKIQKSADIVKLEEALVSKTLTDLINVGNSINMVEPLRDFNGFSWNISVYEIENLYYNLIYQDLIILVGNVFLDEWANKNECVIDYMTIFQSELENKYNKKIANKVIDYLEKLSIFLDMRMNKELIKGMKIREKEVENEIREMANKPKYLEKICIEKKELEKKIKRIDIIANDKKLLQREYKRINNELPIDKKIFSARVFLEKMQNERKETLNKIYECNKLMNPDNYRYSRKKLENEYHYLMLADVENLDESILDNIIGLQTLILEAMNIKAEKITTKNDLMKLVYEFRYFYLLPVDDSLCVGKIRKLSKNINIVVKTILDKAYELKVLDEWLVDEQKNGEIFKIMLSLHIISLKDIYFKIFKENEEYYIQFYDENVVDEKFKINMEIKKEDLKIKLNKKIKLFV